MRGSPRERLEEILAESLAAVHAGAAVARALESDAFGGVSIAGRRVPDAAGIWIAAIGKAAVAMADAGAKAVGERLRAGLVITGDGEGRAPGEPLVLRNSGHPVPDFRGERAARELLQWVAAIPESDVLLVLLSGGASAMASLPAEGLRLSDLEVATRSLLACGADIHAINTVRKHCSGISGGRLALAASCGRIEVLMLSDVRGDSPSTIGSGPCAGDPTTYAEACQVVEGFGLADELPGALLAHLEAGRRGEIPESPGPDHPGLARVNTTVIARNATARSAAVATAARRGECALDLGEILGGEARVAGRRLAALARSIRCDGPTLLVAGGETVVTLTGNGRGGRSQELALAAALEWRDAGRGDALEMLAVGTDGVDGPTDAAGAYVDATCPLGQQASSIEARSRLDDNDSYGFFQGAQGLIRTGPTETNVMDLVFIRIGGRGSR